MEDAQQRKARLKALREAAAVGEAATPSAEPASAGPQEQAAAAEPELKFRNYAVRDQKIEHTVVAPAQPPKYEAPKAEQAVGSQPQDILAAVAPKKPNWDLRRDVEKKLAKLERRTQRAIVQLAQQQQAAEAL